MATENPKKASKGSGNSGGLFERLSGRLPAISVAVVGLVVVGVLASLLLIPGGAPQAPLQAEFPTGLPEPTSPTLIATPTAAAKLSDLPQGTARLTVEPSDSLRFVSSDGGVSIAIDAGSVDEAVSLTFTRLSDFQIPALPRGFSGTQMAFDLSAYSLDGFSLLEYSFLLPITIAIELPASLIDAARMSPVLVALQHFEPDQGWVALPAEYDKESETLTAKVTSLSVFALLVQSSVDGAKSPIQRLQPTAKSISEPKPEPSATATSSPTPNPTPMAVPAPTHTPEPTPTPTSTPSPVPTATASATPSPTPTLVPISAPVLLEPAEGAKLSDTTPTFVWSLVEGTSSVFYELQIDDRTNFGATIVLVNIGTENTFTVAPNQRLDVDVYYWRVRAIDGGRLGSFSEIRTLDVRRR